MLLEPIDSLLRGESKTILLPLEREQKDILLEKRPAIGERSLEPVNALILDLYGLGVVFGVEVLGKWTPIVVFTFLAGDGTVLSKKYNLYI